MQSVLNVRMDNALKERGDKVLADNGLSVSAAVRALWKLMADTHQVPDFLKASSEKEAKKQAKLEALGKLEAIGKLVSASRGEKSAAKSDEQLRDEMYEDMWTEYEALR